MKIILVGAALSNHTIRWVNSLSDKGHDVLLVSRGDQKNVLGDISNKVRIKYLKYGGGLGYILNVPIFKAIVNEFKPDVINVHYATGYGTMARLAKVKPVVLSCWGSDIFEFPYKSIFHKRVLIKNMNYADAVASTSEVMAKEAEKIWGSDRHVIVTPFGVDTNKFIKKSVKRPTEKVIGIVKYLKPIYDIPLLIRAFSIVKEKYNKPLRLEIYGGGELLEELEELTQKLGIEKEVFFYDTISNSLVPDVLNRFDVFVNCSKRESFGVAVIEAMACEKPVVVTDTVGYREIVDNEIDGIILSDREPETMADALLEVLNDEEKANFLSLNAREKVVRKYDWNKCVNIMERVFDEVVK